MKIRMDGELKLEVETMVHAMIGGQDDINRKQLLVSVLLDFLRDGEAERFIRRDGRVGFRATKKLLERIAEQKDEAEMEWEDAED
jgi:hypothetical protein